MISQDLPLSAQVTSIVFEPFCLEPVHVLLSHFHSILSASFPSPSHVVRLQSLLALGCILWPLVSFSLCCISMPASLSSYSTSSRTITLPYTSSHYSIIVEGSANKVDNIIQVGMKSLKKKTWIWQQPQHSSLAGAASLQSSKAYAVFPAHLQWGDAIVLNILPSSALSPSKKSDVKVAALRNSQHPSFLCSHQQASLIYLAQCTSRWF